MSRKDTSFGQLVGYLHKEDTVLEQLVGYIHKEATQKLGVSTLVYNLPSVTPDDLEGITQAFKDNDVFRSQRKNGVVQYHEVISFSPSDRNILAQNPQILLDMARKYLDLRAPNSLAIARPHFDQEHIHLHIMISGNQYQSKESSRISQQMFERVKQELNEYMLCQYPELSNSVIKEHQVKKIQAEVEQIEPVLNSNLDEVAELSLELEEQELLSPYWDGNDSSESLISSPYWKDDESAEGQPSPYWDGINDDQEES